MEVGPCEANLNVVEGCPYFVATEDLPPGHVLFERKVCARGFYLLKYIKGNLICLKLFFQPLLVFPTAPGPRDYQKFRNGMPSFVLEKMEQGGPEEKPLWTCVGCYEVLLYGEIIQNHPLGLKLNKCLSCGWPLHTNIHPLQGPSKCQRVHAEECKILTENGQTWDVVKSDREAYYFLGVLRALMLPPQLMEEFMNLPVYCPQYYSLDFLTSTIPFVRDKCKFGDKFSDEQLKRIILIIFGNIIGPYQQHKSAKSKLVFLS